MLTTKQVAEAIGCHAVSLWRVARNHGIGTPGKRWQTCTFTKKDVERLRGLVHDKCGNPNFAHGKHGAEKRVLQRLREAGVPQLPHDTSVVLTEEQERENSEAMAVATRMMTDMKLADMLEQGPGRSSGQPKQTRAVFGDKVAAMCQP